MVDNVINNVGNVTNITNINQNINNTVINNFGNHYGDNYLNQNNYDHGYHSRPWSTRYDSLHTHCGGSYWNFRYQPQIWVNPLTQVSFGVPVVQYAFSNPYVATSTASYYSGYDYSQPVRISTPDPSGAITEEAIRRFDLARAAFRDNNMQQCLQFVDSAIQLFPDDSVMHELRALALFAQGDYETAASIIYSVLGGGPGSDW
ncbi:MAG: tetratricopeptide repeat protein, partial [Planctomycetaceae bacterium]|nr:tetratricopeptide repeat protein [Planctomycetaceae bacterium]